MNIPTHLIPIVLNRWSPGIAIRLLSIFIVRSSFVPDEYWQSLEVAHKMTFGFGHLTWEWEKQIRSYTYPFMIQILFSAFPESAETVILLPKIFQAVLSTIGDFFTYKLSCKLFGSRCGFWTLFNLLTSWFLFYCSSRTLTNMAETSVTACGLFFYPWKSEKHGGLACSYLWFAGVSTLIRPTAVVLWLPLYLYHLWRERDLFCVIKNTFIAGCVILATLMSCDKYFYGDWVFTPYNFFLFNWRNDIGAFYGQHNFLWYFTTGLPVVLGIHFIPFLMGLSIPYLRRQYFLVFWVIFLFRCVILATLMSCDKYFYGDWVFTPYNFFLFNWRNDIGAFYGQHNFLWYFTTGLPVVLGIHFIPFLMGLSIPYLRRQYFLVFWVIFLFSFLSHKEFRFLLPILPLALIICSAVMNEISSNKMTIFKWKINKQDSKVLFLMPCHSTPYYSYIHQNISMKFLTCQPNLNKIDNYTDEADSFFENPKLWLAQNYEQNSVQCMPSHIVIFDTLYIHVKDFLEQYGYDLCYKTFHSHFPDTRTGYYVLIYCKYS
ncbi:GPI mannosyltransferase 3 [Nephila pilipes]|uniref:Mannosyltransferase n=1 Tax=Nephila pilipes TaxID=299642 RepID=A0A8X6T585_NEPPI|nr:GPI mannosyltransferase 3 [Nephila pilipes]